MQPTDDQQRVAALLHAAGRAARRLARAPRPGRDLRRSRGRAVARWTRPGSTPSSSPSSGSMPWRPRRTLRAPSSSSTACHGCRRCWLASINRHRFATLTGWVVPSRAISASPSTRVLTFFLLSPSEPATSFSISWVFDSIFFVLCPSGACWHAMGAAPTWRASGQNASSSWREPVSRAPEAIIQMWWAWTSDDLSLFPGDARC